MLLFYTIVVFRKLWSFLTLKCCNFIWIWKWFETSSQWNTKVIMAINHRLLYYIVIIKINIWCILIFEQISYKNQLFCH